MRGTLPVLVLALAGAAVVGCGGGGGTPTPKITVTSPNGGEAWVVAESRNITWTSVEVTSNVDIHYTNDSTAGPVVWTEIVLDAADSGSHNWTVPAEDSSNCRVRVQETGGAGLVDQSDADFTIGPPSITVVSPNGGETWYYQGSDHEITWTSVGVAGNVDVHYATDSGAPTWMEIVANVANSGSHTWTIPNANSTTCVVRVQETGGGGLVDQSDGDFAIAQPPAVGFGAPVELTGVSECSLAWGDYDEDGDLDILVAGNDGTSRATTLYERDDAGDFVEETAAVLPDMHQCSVAWADHDNDGDLDIGIGGDAFTGASAGVYRNLGAGQFMNEPSAQVMDLKKCSLAWGDFDNDGLVDIAVAGQTDTGFIESRISRNGGYGTFNQITLNPELAGVYLCSLAWGDYDNDGDLDLAMAGATSPGAPLNPVAKVYRNNADGQFTEETGAAITAVHDCSLAWGDYDSDGDLDLVLAGWDPDVAVDAPVSRLYRNNAGLGPPGEEWFGETGAVLTGVYMGSLAWGDCDSDGDLDLALAGWDADVAVDAPVSKLYRNNADGTFDEIGGLTLSGVYACSVAWGDYDDDGDLDLAMAGEKADTTVATEIYRSVAAVANAAPAAPTGLSAAASGDEVTFSWDAAADAETHSDGLTYSLRVGTSSGDDDVFAGTADLTTGLRLLPAMGNVQENLSWTLKGLAADTYYWSVQALDAGFKRSAWAAEETVSVP